MTNQLVETAGTALRTAQMVQSPPPSRTLTDAQAAEYERNGFLFFEGLFSAEEVAVLRSALPAVMRERTERTVFEVDGETIRSVYGVHQHSPVFSDLARHPRLIGPTRDLLGSDVYVYQSKLNTKAVFGGDVWPWHQDYIFWLNEDGMPAPRALTAAVFLDDVTEQSGSLSLIPGSHRNGIIESDTFEGQPTGYSEAPAWISNLTAKLKYTIKKRAFIELATANDIVMPKGRAGSVVLFDCNTAHASSLNLSPHERRVALLTYNAVGNAPRGDRLHRPEFLVSRDARPLVTVADDVLRATIGTAADAS